MDQPLPTPVAASNALAPGETERRTLPDRRQSPTSPWDAFSPTGQRARNRRRSERSQPYFVDRFSPAMLAFVLILLAASLIDGILTIQLVWAGGDELNPLMGHFLRRGIPQFLLAKYLLTVSGLPLLLIFKNHCLFGTRIRVGHLIPVTVAMYMVLLGYQVILIQGLYPS
jgi:hypothetical protein